VIIDLEPLNARAAPLGDGYRVEASIVVYEGKDRLVVPAGALFRSSEEWATYVVQDGRARIRTVRVGRRSSSAVEITKGLASGDRVVLYPTDSVRDGVRTEIE
jgi:HlyD family secretion protein